MNKRGAINKLRGFKSKKWNTHQEEMRTPQTVQLVLSKDSPHHSPTLVPHQSIQLDTAAQDWHDTVPPLPDCHNTTASRMGNEKQNTACKPELKTVRSALLGSAEEALSKVSKIRFADVWN